MTSTQCAMISGGLTETERWFSTHQSLGAFLFDWNGNKNTISVTTFSNNNVDEIIDFLQAKDIKITDSSEIKYFLVDRAYMIEHLYSIPSKISEYFGKVDIKLSLFRDFDSEIEDAELFIEVKTSLSPQEANNRLIKIYKEWFSSLGTNLDKLNISLNFF